MCAHHCTGAEIRVALRRIATSAARARRHAHAPPSAQRAVSFALLVDENKTIEEDKNWTNKQTNNANVFDNNFER